MDHICRVKGLAWTCSLPMGHAGSHKAYLAHELNKELLETWPRDSVIDAKATLIKAAKIPSKGSPVLEQFRSLNPLEAYANSTVRQFETGATRSSDTDKPDFEGFMNPLVVERFGEYMHFHRHLPDGSLRESDNWQKGIPQEQLIKSGLRHVHDWWMYQRGFKTRELIEDSLCAILFNVSAYLLRLLKDREYRKA